MLSHLAHFCPLEHAIDDILGLFLPRRGHDLSGGELLLLAFRPWSAIESNCLVYDLVFLCCRERGQESLARGWKNGGCVH
jgi:hypothetical protein